VLVFWAQGYEGTSMSDLTSAMRMSAPSIYAAFGNKESLFFKALECYRAGPGSYLDTALTEPTAERVARRFLHSAIDTVSGDDTPHGCLGVHAALAVSPRSTAVKRQVESYQDPGATRLAQRLEQAVEDGDLTPLANATALAHFLIAVVQGIAVQAATGASRDRLRLIADQAMMGWPRSTG
jgi:AcrR family transcriptional regulator